MKMDAKEALQYVYIPSPGLSNKGQPALLHLQDSNDKYHNQIPIGAAHHAQENDCTAKAIKLYNLAEDCATVVACLAQALGIYCWFG